MGEDAIYQGRRITIGTCEEMYYLRADQAHLVQRCEGSLDPKDDRVRFQLRFRFPWPNEDDVAPGAFDGERVLGVSGAPCPEGVEHRSVQFSSTPGGSGYLLSVPCPEGAEGKVTLEKAGLKIHKNGWGGDLRIASQRWVRGEDGHERLVTIAQCGGCRSQFWLDTYEEALPVIEACRRMGDPTFTSRWERSAFWDEVADRIAKGYEVRR